MLSFRHILQKIMACGISHRINHCTFYDYIHERHMLSGRSIEYMSYYVGIGTVIFRVFGFRGRCGQYHGAKQQRHDKNIVSCHFCLILRKYKLKESLR